MGKPFAWRFDWFIDAETKNLLKPRRQDFLDPITLFP
jgi:hypothetical protein